MRFSGTRHVVLRGRTIAFANLNVESARTYGLNENILHNYVILRSAIKVC
jgi:hypothetical protein